MCVRRVPMDLPLVTKPRPSEACRQRELSYFLLAHFIVIRGRWGEGWSANAAIFKPSPEAFRRGRLDGMYLAATIYEDGNALSFEI